MKHFDKKQFNALMDKVMQFIVRVHGDSFMIMPKWLADIEGKLASTKLGKEEYEKLFLKLKNGLLNEYGRNVVNKIIGERASLFG